ncbi:hypothetical protein B0H17DRAFT_1138460 [Mycena rosella]|uniref:Uncharacterized protein n=1 Tax=Mycena rosella TaxID=1033263 RepID=A0AAD7D6B4_MYCRO|nr:hypothetical protein B0H17DRAFT_1138460 [Mycena rosella]
MHHRCLRALFLPSLSSCRSAKTEVENLGSILACSGGESNLGPRFAVPAAFHSRQTPLRRVFLTLAVVDSGAESMADGVEECPAGTNGWGTNERTNRGSPGNRTGEENGGPGPEKIERATTMHRRGREPGAPFSCVLCFELNQASVSSMPRPLLYTCLNPESSLEMGVKGGVGEKNRVDNLQFTGTGSNPF